MPEPPAGKKPKRREYKRLSGYLEGGPSIGSFRCFAEMARWLRESPARSLRSLSKAMGFSPSHLGKWLPEFAAQIGVNEKNLIDLPTPGQPFVRLARNAPTVVRDVEKLLGYYRTVITQAGEMREQIACGTWQWLMAHVFTKVAARFAEEQLARGEATTGLSFWEYDTDAMLQDLSEGSLDVGFGACEKELIPAYEDRLQIYETDIKVTGQLVAIAPAGHVWAEPLKGGVLTLADLVGESLCVARYDVRKRFDNFRPRGPGRGRLVVVENYSSVLGMVRGAAQMKPPGRMVGVVPQFGVQREDGLSCFPELDVYRVTGMNNPADRFAFWIRKSWTPHPEVEKFIACAVEVVNEVWRGEIPVAGHPSTAGRKSTRRRGR